MANFSYPAFTFNDPTQTLPEDFELRISKTDLAIGKHRYGWDAVLIVDAVGVGGDEELMPNLDITIRGVGQFVIEVDDALDARNHCHWAAVDKKTKPNPDFDSGSTFELAGTRGASVKCGVRMDSTSFLPDEVVVFANEHGVLILPTEKTRWHTPLIRWDFSRIESVSDTDTELALLIPGEIGTLLFNFPADSFDAIDDLLATLEEQGCSFVDDEGSFWEERVGAEMKCITCNQATTPSDDQSTATPLPESVCLYSGQAGMGAFDCETWGAPLACWPWKTIETVVFEEGGGLGITLAVSAKGYGHMQTTDLEDDSAMIDEFIADVKKQLGRCGKKDAFARKDRAKKRRGTIVEGRAKKDVSCEVQHDDTASFDRAAKPLPRGVRLYLFADRAGVSLMTEDCLAASGTAKPAVDSEGCWSWGWGKVECVYDYGYMLGLKLKKGGTVDTKVRLQQRHMTHGHTLPTTISSTNSSALFRTLSSCTPIPTPGSILRPITSIRRRWMTSRSTRSLRMRE
jgi:hypothetical protein